MGKPLAQQPGRNTLEGVDQSGQGDIGRIVDQQVDMVMFAIELDQFRAEAVAHLDRDHFAACQEFVGDTPRRYLVVETGCAWRL
ncbi:hypothetical protein Misp02_63400 [Microtetraspora sp. NBRC 16547]|nr:hypothetical protein Misp02_63400 [Microtetraspora sp. NBRC 16547]